jgi:hypothetical protein
MVASTLNYEKTMAERENDIPLFFFFTCIASDIRYDDFIKLIFNLIQYSK